VQDYVLRPVAFADMNFLHFTVETYDGRKKMEMKMKRKVDVIERDALKICEESICLIIRSLIHISESNEQRIITICPILSDHGFLGEIEWKKKNFIMRLC
jgi:hypothetical protein